MIRSRSHAAFAFTVMAMVALYMQVSIGCAANPLGAWPNADHAETFTNGAVAADHPLASEAGAAMLRRGGNAVDAAVATSLALSVVRPYSCGIGGGGFMVIYIPPPTEGDHGQPQRIVLNYRETAPRAVSPDYYLNIEDDEASRFGVHAVGVPGTVAGVLRALDHYGTLDRATVLEPAIQLAEEGFPADTHHIWAMNHLKALIDERPERAKRFDEMWQTLFHRGRMREGDMIRNPQQARALRLIADEGIAAFYHGEIAEAIAKVMEDSGGPITRADLAGYTVDVTTPLHGRFLGHELLTMPPPSSGGVAHADTNPRYARTAHAGFRLPAAQFSRVCPLAG